MDVLGRTKQIADSRAPCTSWLPLTFKPKRFRPWIIVVNSVPVFVSRRCYSGTSRVGCMLAVWTTGFLVAQSLRVLPTTLRVPTPISKIWEMSLDSTSVAITRMLIAIQAIEAKRPAQIGQTLPRSSMIARSSMIPTIAVYVIAFLLHESLLNTSRTRS